LFLRAERTFADLGLPLERARVLLARSVLEKRRRRAGQSRAVYQSAADLFAACGAQVWTPDGPEPTAVVPPPARQVARGSGTVAPAKTREADGPPRGVDAGPRSDPSTRPPLPGRPTRPGKQPAHVTLTPAEQRVVELVAAGCANREVAATLFLSVKTVESVLTGVYRKLGVRSRTQLCLLLNGG
jgi:DNA-binding CsgD family transcriptional regulator